jgi:hypothetical protein
MCSSRNPTPNSEGLGTIKGLCAAQGIYSYEPRHIGAVTTPLCNSLPYFLRRYRYSVAREILRSRQMSCTGVCRSS